MKRILKTILIFACICGGIAAMCSVAVGMLIGPAWLKTIIWIGWVIALLWWCYSIAGEN